MTAPMACIPVASAAGDGGIYQWLCQLGFAQLCGEEFLNNGDFEVFLGGQFLAAGAQILLGGVATLLEHFVEYSQSARIINFDALVNFNAFEFGHGSAG